MENKEKFIELSSRIQNYLGNGGLFNPEFMEHDKVRDLLIDIRDEINITLKYGNE